MTAVVNPGILAVMTALRLVLLALLSWVVVGCTGKDPASGPADAGRDAEQPDAADVGDAGRDAGDAGGLVIPEGDRLCERPDPVREYEIGGVSTARSSDRVDLLLVLDDSETMAPRRAGIVAQLPELIRRLVTADVDGDGTIDPLVGGDPQRFPVRSLHFGVVSADLGAGGRPIERCSHGPGGAAHGDDGLLEDTLRGATCPGADPSGVFSYAAGDDVAAFTADAFCPLTTRVREPGCDVEQPLEAALKALSRSEPGGGVRASYDPPAFFDRTSGHGDGANAGFLRQASLLAVIVITDEDDCSIADARFFDTADGEGVHDADLRCFRGSSKLRNVTRFALGESGRAGLAGLRTSASYVFFGAITGLPTELSVDWSNASAPAFANLLSSSPMQLRAGALDPTRLMPACVLEGGLDAYPARRITETAHALWNVGAHVTLHSICAENALADTFEAMAHAIGNGTPGGCPAQPVEEQDAALEGCVLLEPVLEGVDCDQHSGREPAPESLAAGRGPRCLIHRLTEEERTAGDVAGWYFVRSPDEFASAYCGWQPGMRFVDVVPLGDGALVGGTLVCPISAHHEGARGLGSWCTTEERACESGFSVAGLPMSCDSAIDRCSIQCSDLVPCVALGLPGDVCDTRPWRNAVGLDEVAVGSEEYEQRLARIPEGAEDQPHGFCVPATCFEESGE